MGFLPPPGLRGGVAPSPQADRVTLVRRLSFDLRGLPPLPEEVRAFVADRGAFAYESLVNRMLSSRHYGERWARHWLDVARYADSNGYTRDFSRQIWKYRDWCIEAFNRDLPFDQFIIEQIAGDLLPGATLDQIVATGFHRNTLFNEEGGTDPEQFRLAPPAAGGGTSVFSINATIGLRDPPSRRLGHKRVRVRVCFSHKRGFGFSTSSNRYLTANIRCDCSPSTRRF